jgi:HEAT repeat protein
MTTLAKARRERLIWAVPVAALAAFGIYYYGFREAKFRGQPASWWAAQALDLERRQEPQRKGQLLEQAAHLYVIPEQLGDGPVTARDVSNPDIVPVLEQMTKHPSLDVRFRAACWLCGHGPEGMRRAVPVLADAVANSPEPVQRYSAAWLLSEMEARHARPAVDALVKASSDEVFGVRTQARQALRGIDPAAWARAGSPLPGR